MNRIIVVEDEGITAMHLREMLDSWGYEVTATVDNAEEALERITAEKPDLVLMDIRLKGGMDGIAVAELVQRRFDLPVVFLSAHSDAGTMRRVKRCRAAGFIVKPFDETDVKIEVTKAFCRHRLDRALRSTPEWHAGPLTIAEHAIIATDDAGRVMFLNDAAEVLTGWKENEAFRRDTSEVLCLVDQNRKPPAEHPVSQALSSAESFVSEPDTVVVSRDGREVSIGYRVLPVFDAADNLIGSVISLRHQRDRIRHGDLLSHHPEWDLSSGLANRTVILDCLGDAIARAHHDNSLVAIMILDIDRFKEVNTSHGNVIGDLLLGAVAARVENCIRGSDSVARVGGDEIAVIQIGLGDTSGAAYLAEKLVDLFSDPYVIEGREIKTTVSVGVAVYPVDGDRPEELVDRAEEAVNRAKAAGRNQYNFHGNINQGLVDSERSLERDLRLAMDRNQFEVWYQPIFNLGRHEIIGAEALLRWRHPERGVIPASRIIPLADRCGLLAHITDWVFEEALMRSGEWQGVLPGVRVSVNLAESDLRRRDLVPTVIRALGVFALESRHLELEIREDLVIRQLPMTSNFNLQRLRQLGVSLTLDNFGFAYASMKALTKLPLSRLKIDRLLVSEVTHDPQTQAIVKATIDLSQSCGYEIVANGIETKEQLQWLRLHGCDHGQGSFLGSPRRAEDLLTDYPARRADSRGKTMVNPAPPTRSSSS